MYRPSLFGFLCFIAALGQAPAWLHIRHCGDRNVLVATGCEHGCHHHHKVAAAASSETGDRRSSDGHDEDSCAICQSLSTPCGVAWAFDRGGSASIHVSPAMPLSPSIGADEFRFVAAPRGPPLIG